MEEIQNETAAQEQPCMHIIIGKTTYLVRVHFSKTSTETVEQKIIQMMKKDINGIN